MLEIELANRQSTHCFDADRLISATRMILADEGIEQAVTSIAVVDDGTIHELNRRYLGHDYPTDVLSFPFERSANHLEGEVIVSAETAAAAAPRYGWSVEDELLLYVIHGTLHLLGYDDTTTEKRDLMRSRECHYLGRFGLAPRYQESAEGSAGADQQQQGGGLL